MKPQMIMAGLLSTYTVAAQAQPASAATPLAPRSEGICSVFETQKRGNLIANYSTQLNDGTTFCAKLLKTDDKSMLELILFKKDKSGNTMKYGDNAGDDETIYLIYNPKNSSVDKKGYVGITCNSSQGCATGETFIATLEENGKELYLYTGKYGNDNRHIPLKMLPSEISENIGLERE